MTTNQNKILFVDDDVNLLNGLRRSLGSIFNIRIANEASEGLLELRGNGPFAVVVSDFLMPGQNGVDFLAEVKNQYPDSVRILFSGNADLSIALEAVNQGHVYQIIAKPTSKEKLSMILRSAMDYYNLVMGEKILLEQTLKGTVDTLLNIIGFMHPPLFSRTLRLKSHVTSLARYMKAPEIWKYQIAANLSQIGTIILPEEVVKKVNKGETLSADEVQMVEQHPCFGGGLIDNIPRLDDIAKIVTYQQKHFDGTGVPRDALSGEDIPFGSRLLKVALDYDELRMEGHPVDTRLSTLKKRAGRYDPKVLQALEETVALWFRRDMTPSSLLELKPGMIISEGIFTDEGHCLVPEGQEITESLVIELHTWTSFHKIREPILVMPVTEYELIHK